LTYFLVAQLVIVNAPMMPYPATKRLKAQAITDAEPYTVSCRPPTMSLLSSKIASIILFKMYRIFLMADEEGLRGIRPQLDRQIHPDITSL
jgi:hypothetical protein